MYRRLVAGCNGGVMRILGRGLAIACALVSVPAMAAPQWCQSKIEHSFVDRYGNVYVWAVFRQDYIQICNVDAPWKGVSVELCRTWQALSMSAILSDKPMIIFYDDAASCQTVPAYDGAPSPGYMMLRKQ